MSLRNYLDQPQTEAFDKHGAFFAFSDKQYEAAAKPGVTYVHVGAGLYCPKENAESLLSDLAKATDNAYRQDFADNGAEKIIRREYFNYETHISLDDGAAFLQALAPYRQKFPDQFTVELIEKMINQCYQDAIEDGNF